MFLRKVGACLLPCYLLAQADSDPASLTNSPASQSSTDFVLPATSNKVWTLGQAYNYHDHSLVLKNVVQGNPGATEGCADYITPGPGEMSVPLIDRCAGIVNIINKYEFSYSVASSLSDIATNMDINAGLQLGLMNGKLDLSLQGQYLKNGVDTESRSHVIMSLKFLSGVKSFDFNKVIPVGLNDYQELTTNLKATHYVKDILYGGSLYADISYKKSDSTTTMVLKAAAEAKYADGDFDASVNGNIGYTSAASEAMEEIQINIFGTPAPIFMPTTLEEFFDFINNYEEFLQNFNPEIPTEQLALSPESEDINKLIGVPVKISMGDITEYAPGPTEILMNIPHDEQIKTVIDQINDITVSKKLAADFLIRIDEFERKTGQRDASIAMKKHTAGLLETTLDIFDTVNSVDLQAVDVDLIPAIEAYNRVGANYPCRRGAMRFGRQIQLAAYDVDVCMPDEEGNQNYCNGNGKCIVTFDNEHPEGDPLACVGTVFKCECDAGWSGDRCDVHVCDNHADVTSIGPCRNNPVSCDVTTSDNGYRCTCSKPFSGNTCEIGYCETAMRDGSIGPCENGSSCTNLPSFPFFQCDCTHTTNNAYRGQYCSVHVCDVDDPCNGNGQCIKTDDGGFTCECFPGYHSENNCEVSYCQRDPVTGSAAPCGEHGSCVMEVNTATSVASIRCDCAPYRRGDRCELHVHCDYETGDPQNPCKNGGQCVEQFEPPYFRCECPDNYLGVTCSEPICNSRLYREDVDFCGRRGCEQLDAPEPGATPIYPNFGMDINRKLKDYYGFGFKCGDCSNHWSGEACEHNICDDPNTNPCKYEYDNQAISGSDSIPKFTGKCVPSKLDHGYTCECFPGWWGQNCEHSVCDGLEGGESFEPCRTGVCTARHDAELGFICEDCAKGWYGDFCDKHVCDNDVDPICKNGGVCSPDEEDEVFGFKCDCIVGTQGRTCEEATPQDELNTQLQQLGIGRKVAVDYKVTTEDIAEMVNQDTLKLAHQNLLHYSHYFKHNKVTKSDQLVSHKCHTPNINEKRWRYSPNQDAWYFFSKQKLDQNAAEKDCKSRGGHLTSVANSEEYMHIRSLVNGESKFWIGMTQMSDGYWRYLDGCKSEDAAKMTKQSVEKCVVIDERRLTSSNCTEPLNYVCKSACSEKNCKNIVTKGYKNYLTDGSTISGSEELSANQIIKFDLLTQGIKFDESSMTNLRNVTCEQRVRETGWFTGFCDSLCNYGMNNCGQKTHLSTVPICAAFGRRGRFVAYSHPSALSFEVTKNSDTCSQFEFTENRPTVSYWSHDEFEKSSKEAEFDSDAKLDAVIINLNGNVKQQEKMVKSKDLVVQHCRHIPSKSKKNSAYFWCNGLKGEDLMISGKEVVIKEVQAFDFDYKYKN